MNYIYSVQQKVFKIFFLIAATKRKAPQTDSKLWK